MTLCAAPAVEASVEKPGSAPSLVTDAVLSLPLESFPIVSGHVFARLRWGRAALIEMETMSSMHHHPM